MMMIVSCELLVVSVIYLSLDSNNRLFDSDHDEIKTRNLDYLV